MSDTESKSWLERIDDGISKGEAFLVVFVLAVMVGLSALQLFLHTFFDTGFEWADIVVRQMVLWLGFLGGALATHEGRHIAIDALGKFLAPRAAATVRVLTSTAAMVLSAVMFHAAWTFVSEEIEAESTIFAEIPAWPFEIVMPLALAAIVFHFFVAVVKSVQVAMGKREPPVEELEDAV